MRRDQDPFPRQRIKAAMRVRLEIKKCDCSFLPSRYSISWAPAAGKLVQICGSSPVFAAYEADMDL